MPAGAAPEPRPIRPPRDWGEVAKLGGFHREIGLTIDPSGVAPGACTVEGTVEARHLNINQVVHGGVYATILDTAMGGAVITLLTEEEVTATTSLYVEFLRPAREGQKLRARGEVVRRGRHLAFVQGALHDGDGALLGQGSGTWYIWARGDGTWSGAPSAKARSGQAAAPSSRRTR